MKGTLSSVTVRGLLPAEPLIDTQQQTENGEHLQAVVLNKTSTPVHGLKGSAAVMIQQRQRQHLGEEAGSNDQSSKDYD